MPSDSLSEAQANRPGAKQAISESHARPKARDQNSLHSATVEASKLFYLPALVAIRHNPAVKPFYEKLVAKGKPKKSALIACERKLLMICYGVVKSGKPFEVTP